MKTKSILTAAIVGAIMGVAYQTIIYPLIEKPVEDKVKEVIEK